MGLDSHFGFDLDDTLDHPSIVDILLSVYARGHPVTVISGSKRKTLEAVKRKQMEVLGVPEKVPLYIVHGATFAEIADGKAELVLSLGIDLFIDDHPLFCSTIREKAPGVVVLRVSGPRVQRSKGRAEKLLGGHDGPG